MHIEEYFTDCAVVVFAGTQIYLMAADDRLLGITFAPMWQTVTTGWPDGFDNTLDDALGDNLRSHRRIGICHRRQIIILQKGCIQGLAEFGTIPIKGVSFQAKSPGKLISGFAILNGGRVRHVDGFRDGT